MMMPEMRLPMVVVDPNDARLGAWQQGPHHHQREGHDEDTDNMVRGHGPVLVEPLNLQSARLQLVGHMAQGAKYPVDDVDDDHDLH